MRQVYNRKTSPKVIGGHVQRKNNHVKTARLGYVIDRVRPGKGFVHVLSKKDIHDFTDLIPDWDKVSDGIEAIYLSSESESCDGSYRHYLSEGTGAIWLNAWQKDLWVEYNDKYYQEHAWLFKALGVLCESKELEIDLNDTVEPKNENSIEQDSEEGHSDELEDKDKKNVEIVWTCFFTSAQAKAYMLMHIFLHELGHHVDKLRSKKQDRLKGDEAFAENYAIRRFNEIWPAYIQRFGNPKYSR